MRNTDHSEKFLNVCEVAARYNVGRATVWRWCAARDDCPEAVKLGPGVTRWRLSDLIDFESGKSQGGAS